MKVKFVQNRVKNQMHVKRVLDSSFYFSSNTRTNKNGVNSPSYSSSGGSHTSVEEGRGKATHYSGLVNTKSRQRSQRHTTR